MRDKDKRLSDALGVGCISSAQCLETRHGVDAPLDEIITLRHGLIAKHDTIGNVAFEKTGWLAMRLQLLADQLNDHGANFKYRQIRFAV